MTPKEINSIISFHVSRIGMWDYVTVNDRQIHAAHLRMVAKEGDRIYWEKTSGRYADSRHFVIDEHSLAMVKSYEVKKVTYRGHRLRDSQRSLLYTWEKEIVDRGHLPVVANPKRLVQEVFEAYGLEALVPRVEVSHRKTRSSSYHGGFQHKIVLAASWGTQMEVVLHETAHALLAVGYGSYDEAGSFRVVPHEPHGPEFAALLFELYDLYLPRQYFHPERAKTRIRIDTNFCLASHVKAQREVSPLYLKRASFTASSLDTATW